MAFTIISKKKKRKEKKRSYVIVKMVEQKKFIRILHKMLEDIDEYITIRILSS